MRRIDIIGTGATDLEIEAAEKLLQHVTYADQVLFCLTGSEATHTALRLARSATGRRKIVKFQGCYHGWHDAVLANVITPPTMVDRVHAISSGMVPGSLDHTLICEFNDVAGLQRTFQEHGDDIAAVIMEPIPHNVGCLLPTAAFLESARALCDRHGSVLIFDEVVTGIRHGLGGFGRIAGVEPDLTTFGKALGNGYPVAAVCGRASIMAESATAGGPAFFAGTYNGHPIGMAAMIATFERLESGEVYEHIFGLGERMRAGLKWAGDDVDVATFSTGFGSLFVLYFLEGPVRSYRDLLANDITRFVGFQQGMTEAGFFMLPINLKRSQVSAAHTQADVDRAIETAATVLRSVSDRVPAEVDR
jgi:glutamate-1-semialdehyde 2,1-aminomutase